MTMARSQLVNVAVTRWYHCITRCVRRAFLLGEAEGESSRKEWIEKRLEELAGIFAIAVGGFSIMDNHLHVLVRLHPDLAQAWSDEEVVKRWGQLFPPRDKSRQPLPVSNEWVQWRLKDAKWVATARERLQSLSWFMKCLKEPLARLANRHDKVRGAFFEERFKSIGILDEESLLATCAYIDLNPVAAGIAETPEASPHTSVSTRVDHVKAQGRTEDLQAAAKGTQHRQTHPQASKIQSGFARSKIGAGSTPRAEGCSKASRWEVTCFWSTTPAGSFAKAKSQSRPSWPEFWND